MALTYRILHRDEEHALDRVHPDVFDGPIQPGPFREFLEDPRHHLAIATEDSETVVGMASAVHFVHPDKPPQLFINEVGVAGPYRNRGVGSRLLRELLDRGRQLGCTISWVATESENEAARALYRKVGGLEAPESVVMYTFDLQEAGTSGGREAPSVSPCDASK